MVIDVDEECLAGGSRSAGMFLVRSLDLMSAWKLWLKMLEAVMFRSAINSICFHASEG